MMKLSRTVAAACLAAFLVAPAVAQPEGMPSKKEVAAAMSAMGGPVEEHKVLEALVGKFEGTVMLPLGPGMEMEMNIVADSKWILGERFVQGMNTAAEDEELDVESQFTFGFDKRTSKYFVFGIDTTDTYSVFAEGDYDEEAKTITLYGENLEMSLGQTLPFKFVFDLGGDEDGNEGYTTGVWFQMEGAPTADEDGWFPVMKGSMTRTD